MGKVKLKGYKRRLYENLKTFHENELKYMTNRKTKLENKSVPNLKSAKDGIAELKLIEKDIEKVKYIVDKLKTGWFKYDIEECKLSERYIRGYDHTHEILEIRINKSDYDDDEYYF